jgi:hypothetical protein
MPCRRNNISLHMLHIQIMPERVIRRVPDNIENNIGTSQMHFHDPLLPHTGHRPTTWLPGYVTRTEIRAREYHRVPNLIHFGLYQSIYRIGGDRRQQQNKELIENGPIFTVLSSKLDFYLIGTITSSRSAGSRYRRLACGELVQQPILVVGYGLGERHDKPFKLCTIQEEIRTRSEDAQIVIQIVRKGSHHC